MRHGLTAISVLLSIATVVSVASAEDKPKDKDAEPDLPRLGLAPGEPQVHSAPPTVPFGIHPAESRELVLDFHGYLLLPAVVGFHERIDPGTGQSSTSLHSPPTIPQDLRGFEYTGVIPSSWAQLNFVYGNSTVSATVVLAAQALSDAASYYNPTDQLGVNDAYVSVNLSKTFKTPFEIKVGALTGRYGPMGAYDAGRYGTPLIARTNAIGEVVTAGFKADKAMFVIEQGIGGQLGRPPAGLVPAAWNGYADPNTGSTFLHHLHAGVSYDKLVQLGLHWLTAWSQDDRGLSGRIPDGTITIIGADAHVTAGRAGHLYAGFAHTGLTNAEPVGGVIEVLNARGGPEIIANYLGPKSGGNGSLSTFGAQYDLSVSRAAFGDLYKGTSPDVLVSLFAAGTSVKSNDADYDGVFKFKAGGEATYTMTSWFGLSTRFDHVRLHGGDDTQAFNILSGRLLFHTDWQSRDEFAIQYSHLAYGSNVNVLGYPAYLPNLPLVRNVDPSIIPDKDVIALSGTFWW